MKKTLLLASLLVGSVFTVNAQTVLFEDSFETYDDFLIENIGDWTQIDVDGLATWAIESEGALVEFTNSGYTGTAIVFNPSQTNPALGGNWAPRTGDKSLNFFAAAVAPGQSNNDYFITPQITLGESGNVVSFWAKSITDQWGLERLRVAISTTGNTEADFTTSLTAGSYVEVPTGEDWTEYSFDLDAYAGQDVYIALNYVTSDAFALLVDDFSVTAATASVDSHLASSFSVYPNPVKDVLNISNSINAEINSVIVTDINGRTVKQVNSNVSQINIADLNAGVYFVNINSTEGSLTKKVVKQ